MRVILKLIEMRTILINRKRPTLLKMSQYTTIILSLSLIFYITCGNFNATNISERTSEIPISRTESIKPKLKIMTSTPILADWVNQVANNRLIAKPIIPYGVNPHSYQPGAKDIARITESDLIFTVGLKYESQPIAKLLNNHPNIKKVPLGDFISPIQFARKNKHNETHHEDEHGIYDTHFWFDPIRVISAIHIITTELSTLDPPGTNKYKTKASGYIIELEKLDTHIKDSISRIPKDHRSFMTAHESLGYLKDRYDLNVIESVIPNLDSTIGVNPRNLVNAVELIKENDIQVIFLENDTPDKSVKTVADETGIRIVTGLSVETLSNNSQTYVDFMENNIQVIVENLNKYVRK